MTSSDPEPPHETATRSPSWACPPTRPGRPDRPRRLAAIAAATHPDRADGGDLARYTQASAAYDELRTPWGRSEAYADLIEQLPDTTPLPPVPPGWHRRPPLTIRPLLQLPARIRHGRPLRLAIRAITAAMLSLVVLDLIPGQPAAPALVIGLITWFALTGPLGPGTASIEGINATTVLVRRVKQGVAEWFRLQLKEKA